MNIAISGSDGFIGSSIIRSISEYNYYLFKHSKKFSAHKNIFYLNLSDKRHVGKLIEKLRKKRIDVFLHLAAVIPYSGSKRFLDWSNDLEMAKNVTLICKRLSIKKLIFISGWVVYGEQSVLPIKENSKLNPSTEYGNSKVKVENYFRKYMKGYCLIILRLASIFGPGQFAKGLIRNIATSAIENKRIFINSKETRRDYLYISDLVLILKKIIKKQSTSLILNIGSGKSYSIWEIALTVQKIFLQKFNTKVQVVLNAKVDENKIRDNRLNIRNMQRLFGRSNFINLEDGLLNYIKWLKEK